MHTHIPHAHKHRHTYSTTHIQTHFHTHRCTHTASSEAILASRPHRFGPPRAQYLGRNKPPKCPCFYVKHALNSSTAPSPCTLGAFLEMPVWVPRGQNEWGWASPRGGVGGASEGRKKCRNRDKKKGVGVGAGRALSPWGLTPVPSLRVIPRENRPDTHHTATQPCLRLRGPAGLSSRPEPLPIWGLPGPPRGAGTEPQALLGWGGHRQARLLPGGLSMAAGTPCPPEHPGVMEQCSPKTPRGSQPGEGSPSPDLPPPSGVPGARAAQLCKTCSPCQMHRLRPHLAPGLPPEPRGGESASHLTAGGLGAPMRHRHEKTRHPRASAWMHPPSWAHFLPSTPPS